MSKLGDFTVVPGGVVAPREFLAGTASAGIKADGNLDMGAILSTRRPCTAVGTFTSNRVRGASIDINIDRLADGYASAIIFNSGNANTYTGPEGHADALRMTRQFAEKQNLPEDQVLVASTGVIGFRLPMDKVTAGIATLKLDSNDGLDLARAMMTTDVAPKSIAIDVPLRDTCVRIGGAAKGAGMIHPNMGTMFAFLTTDAALHADHAHQLLRTAVEKSFNLISIDGDESTSDTALLFANGAAMPNPLIPGSGDEERFAQALDTICQHLAQEILRGGEGVTKVFAVEVTGASSQQEARRAARAISTSMLVKTAIHGGDPNWGRVVMAVGNSGIQFDPAVLDICIGDTQVVHQGRPTNYNEASVATHLQGAEARIGLNLHAGDWTAVAWGTDLSKDYVDINSAYMT